MSRFFKYIFTFILLTNSVLASTLYWVNGTGSWNDPSHWSLVSGGKGNAGIPTLEDNVIFDQNSFNNIGQTITIKKQAFCNNFTWKYTGLNPVLNGKSRSKLTINGSLNIDDQITGNYNGSFIFTVSGNSTVSTISGLNANLIFNNPEGIFKINSDLITTGNIYLLQGFLNTNNQNITCSEFNISGSLNRSLYLSSSYITIDKFNAKVIENLIFNAGTSTLFFNKKLSYKIMNIGPLQYSKLRTPQKHEKAGSAAFYINAGCNGDAATDTIRATITGGSPNYIYILTGEDVVTTTNPTHDFTNVTWATGLTLTVFESGGTFVDDTTFDLVEPPALVFQIDTNQEISCYGLSDGELEANVVGANTGTPPYKYIWTPNGATTKINTGLGVQLYRVTVTDNNGCSYSPPGGAILYTPPISIDAVDSTNACQGVSNGTITITASGGTGTLQYSLDNGVVYPYQNNNTFSGLAAGTYEIWVKDANACTTQRSIDATVVETPAPSANAGVDGTVCEDDSFTITVASASEYSSLLWTSAGDGTWQNETTLTPTYTPGATDKTNGSVVLTLHANGNTPCNEATDDMTLNVNLLPVANAGSDATVCEGDPFTVSTASQTNASSILWSHNGTGTLTDETTLTPTYTPGAGESGIVRLTMQVFNPPCSDASDFMDLTLSPAPTADAGADGDGCKNKDFVISGASATNYSSLLWSTGGDGSFTNGTTLSPTYTPGATDNTNGSVVLTLTAVGNGTCGNAVDNMTLTLNPEPVANAGSDGETCENSTFTPSDASATNSNGVYLWSSAGDGTWQNETTLTPTYTPGAADKTNGSVVLTLTVNGNGTCDPVSDNMTLTITTAPTANAGSDLETCQGIAVTVSDATVSNQSSVLWTTTGTGVITNPATLTPTYNPGAGETGNITMTINANGNGSCATATDDITITINTAPTVNLGADDDVCSNVDYVASAATATNYTSLLWSSSGDGTFDDTGILNATYTPGTTDETNGSVVLTLTATGNTPCANAQDNITITITPAPTANAGSDATICEDGTFQPSDASVSNQASINWTTSGDGSFANANTITPTYTPGATDKSNGTVTLTLHATGNGSCAEATDNMVLIINALPTANAGNDETICEGDDLSVSTATASNYSTLLWSTAGDGSFTNGNTLTPTYTPGNADKTAGSVILTLLASGNAPCANASDNMTLTITPAPTADAGGNADICETDTYSPVGTATNYASVNWTTSGDGSFTGQTTLTPTYTPSTNDINSGTVTLTLHAVGNGTCAEVTSDAIITIYKSPTVNAGGNSEICSNAAFTASSASASNYTTLLWSSTGDGFFDNASVLNAVYNPGATDISNGTVTLTLFANANAPCVSVSDNLILTITPEPTADAGSDATVCEGNTFTPSDAAATNNSAISWTSSGDGTFTNETTLFPIYTPSTNDIAAGTVTLTIHSLGNGSCVEATNDMTLTIEAAPTANAGVDTSICYEDSYTLADAVATNYTSVLWSTSGDGTFDNSAIQNPVYTPGPQDQTDGSVTLTLQANGNAPCSNVTDDMVLTITSELVASIGTPAPFTITATTEIEVSFTADHDLVQDIGFYLVAPDGTTIELMASPSSLGLCNLADGANVVDNFTFSSTSTNGTFDKCPANGGSAPVDQWKKTLTGTWESENAFDPLFGKNPAAGGWSVQIRDCASGADGTLTNVILKFKEGTDSVYYNSGTISVPINSPTGAGCVNNSYYMSTPNLTTSCYNSCDATAVLSISGGSGSYTIQWEGLPQYNDSTTVDLCAGVQKAIVTDAVLGCTDTAEVTVLQPPQITLTKDSTNVTCKGADNGTASVTPSNGNAPYVYAWTKETGDTVSTTSSANSLIPGKYYIYVTDDNGNGCMVLDSVNITEPDSITYTSVITQTNCNGSTGIITITPAGGTPSTGATPYTYAWSPNVTETDSIAESLSVGIYKFTITDANSCTKTDSLEMTDAGTIAITTFDTTSVSAAGICDGTAKVNYAGETGTVSYQWDDPASQTTQTATGLCGGVAYIVTVTDDNTNCSDIGTITLWEPTAVSVDITDSTMVLCNGDATGAATATATGGTGVYTYEWRDSLTMTLVSSTNTASDLIAGKYYITVNGTAKDSITITQPDAISANLSITNPNCNQSNGIIAVIDTTGGVGNFSFTWDADLTTITTGGDSALNVASGAYDIIVVDGNACQLPLVANVSEITPFSISISDSTLVSCNGLSDGNATVTVTGATNPVNYVWSNGDTTAFADTLSAQTYTVSVTDASTCTAVTTVNITEPLALTTTLIDTVHVKCYGDLYDSVTVSVSGGTENYMFSWSTGSTDSTAYNLPGGFNNVIITDANNCTAYDTVFVKQPDIITIDTLLTLANCGDSAGQIKVTPAGGTAPYDFRLYNADSVLIDSAFTLTTYTFDTLWVDFYGMKIIDANACELLEIVRVSDTSSLTTYINPDSVGHLTCNTVCDGHALVEVSGGTPDYSYLWNGGVHADSSFVDSLCAGFYIVTITDANSCSHVDSVTISDDNILQANIKESGNASCNGLADGFAIGEGLLGTPFTTGEPYQYKWDDPTASTNDTINNLSAGWYRLTVTDANLCEAYDSVEITEPFALSYSTTKLDVACYGDSTGSLRIEPVGGTPPFTILAFNPDSVLIDSVLTDTVLNLANLYAGKYYFTIRDFGLCEISGNRSVDQANQIIPTISRVKTDCADSTGSFTVDNVIGGLPGGGSYTVAYNYKWSHPSWTSDSTRYKIENLWVDFYDLNIEDSYGCSIDTTLEMIDNSNIDFVIIIDTAIYCQNDSNAYAHIDTASATGTTGSSATWTYQWWQDNNRISDSIYADSLYLLTYKAYLIDQIGCRKIKQFEIPDSSLKATFVNTNNFSCSEENFGSSTVTAQGGMYPYIIKWYLSDGITPYIDTTRIDSVSIRANHLAAGTYIVEITDANPKGCTLIDSTEIYEPDAFELEFINRFDIACYGYNTGAVTVKASGGVPPYEFIWIFNADTIPVDSIIVTDTSATIQHLYAGQYNISILDSRGIECGIDSVVEILQPEPITWDYIITKTNCNDSTGSFSIDITDIVPPTAPFIVTWDNNGFSTPFVGEDINNLWVDTFYVQIQDNNGCLFYDSVLMPDNSDFEVSLSAVNPRCSNIIDGNLTINEEIPGVLPYSYIWSTSPVDTVSQSTLFNLDEGDYSVTVIDAEMCKRYKSATLTKPDTLILRLIDSSYISCEGDSTGSLTAVGTGGTPQYEFRWYYLPTTYYTTYSSDTSTISSLQADSYTIRIVDNNGCTSVDTNYTMPSGASPKMEWQFTVNKASCYYGISDGSVSLNVTGGTQPLSYNWSTGGNSSFVTNLSADTVNYYTVTVVDDSLCTFTDSVMVYADLDLRASTNDTTICFGDSVQLSGNITAIEINDTLYVADSVIWRIEDSVINNNSSYPYVTLTNEQQYIYDIYKNGCYSFDTLTISVYDELTISADFIDINDTTLFEGSKAELIANGGDLILTTYLWLPDTMFMTRNDTISPVSQPKESITYTVYATTGLCTVSDTIFIKVLPEVKPAEGISPNGDGINDTWEIGNLSDYPNVEIIIFNRWGEKIFTSVGYKEPWDGKSKTGKDLPVGTYYYIIDFHDELGKKKPITGPITILR